ncbi:hypothetical protein AXW67_33480 [Bradyrhizobium neotropicale]|uniref:histidine kinase n=2 Tax=Bradyrhizobium neotropicale TaxID=1497615 RepID=A0A176ZI23_9BRAD|nr:hypothetical protein AXW67_33480 [Bradyrhizobium neotropicale]
MRLEHEFSFVGLLERDWADVPAALVSTVERTALIFSELRGLSFDTFIRLEHRPSVDDFLRIAVSASSVLVKLGERGIVHCNIKPTNLFSDAAGNVRLHSFGSAFVAGMAPNAGVPLQSADCFRYAAPEQARRHAPYCDHRSDLYSLGAVLYEVATGEPPLKAPSTQEWLHAHVAVEAVRPSTINTAVPGVLDDIITKLIAKDPLDRYQSALALHADLVRCQVEWSATRRIDRFQLGRADISSHRAISQHLVGRSVELGLLVSAHNRVADSGTTEIVLLSGAPGAGKTSLVERLAQIVGQSGTRFASGKGDLLQCAIPYAPLIQVLRSLFTRLLSESNDSLIQVRQRLVASLKGYAPILTEFVPEAEFVIDRFPPLPSVPTALAQARIQRVIAQTLSAFSKNEQLVIFFDDLQWADKQTLAIISTLVDQMPANILFIGAYRDAEASSPALKELLSTIRMAPISTTNIEVHPLTVDGVARLTANILNSSESESSDLAQIIQAKTGGNPFHVIQLLQQLIDDRTIAFDIDNQRWDWNTTKTTYDDSVISFMARRLDTLPSMQRRLLCQLACFDGRCDEGMLVQLSDLQPLSLEEALKPLLEAGFLTRSGATYVISHDRILEAAYSLIPFSDRPREHARIATLMIGAYGESNADVIFEIASQIERAATAPIADSDRLPFARTLLAAARRAGGTGAAERAADYLAAAKTIVRQDFLAKDRALVFDVAYLDCRFLVAAGSIEEASRAIGPLFALAANPVDQADVYRLKAIILTVRSDYEGAIDAALKGLELLRIELKRHPTSAVVDDAFTLVRKSLMTVTADRLVSLPQIEDRTIQSAMALLSTLSASFFVEGGLSLLHTAKIVELTLQHGVAPESSYGLAWFGVFAAGLYGAYSDGFVYADLAARLVERDGFEVQRTATLLALDQVSPWTQPLRFALTKATEALKAAYVAGDIGMTCYARNHIASNLIALGEPLSIIRDELEDGIATTRKLDYKDIEYILRAQLSFVQVMQAGWDSVPPLAERDRGRSYSTRFFIAYYHGLASFFSGNLADADRLLNEAIGLSWAAPAHMDAAYCRLFLAMTIACTGHESDQVATLDRLTMSRTQFSAWAALNPATFGNKLLLIEAAIARVRNDPMTALALYERSAIEAHTAGFLHEEALAYELAGKLCLAGQLTRSAESHFRASRDCYDRWGAKAKARGLVDAHPHLFDRRPAATGEPSDLGQAELDIAVVMKAAQAVSQEILLDRVIKVLMTEMIVHVGARFGLLLLMHDDAPIIEAAGQVVDSEVEVVLGTSIPSRDTIPVPILNTVVRTRQAVVLSDAQADSPHDKSAWPANRRVRSLICQPLIKSSALVGVLYLENNLAPGVFTRNRTAILDVLAPQAAISLDAARLYKRLEEENSRRAQAEVALRQARSDLARKTHLTVLGELAASIAHEINQPLSSIVSYADAGLRWLERDVPDIGEALVGMRQVRDGAMRAAGIVKALRSLAKQTTPTPEKIDLHDLIRTVILLTTTEIEANDVRIVTELRANRHWILADAVQLQQVVLNLITNAIDAMAELPPEQRELNIRSDDDGDSITISVEDRGRGIEADSLECVFEPLFTTKASGMGMGLAICKSIIEAHNGKLNAISSPGVGSTFFFRMEGYA